MSQARAYPGFCSIKRLGMFLIPGPGWNAGPSRGYNPPPPPLTPTRAKLHVFNAPGWRESLCLQLLEIIESILHSSDKSGYFPQPHPIILLLIGFLVFYPLMVILGKKFTFLILIT